MILVDGTAISAQGLSKRYGAHEAVRGIDLEVREGEVYGFLGANGAGKTTTIEILEGYRSRSAGEVSVLGVDPAQPSRAWRERVGLVLQRCELDPLLTARETLSLYATLFARPRPVDDTLALVGLSDQSSTRLGRLSGGQKRRVDVAVALVGDPDLIFLDEPTTGFDPSARRDAWRMIEGLKALGKTVFLTTHYLDEAQHLSDRVAILRDGQIIAEGAPDEIGRGGEAVTVVRFRLPERVTIQDVRAQTEGAEVESVAGLVEVRTRDAQRTLQRLTGWAQGAGLRLEDLEARRPSLEDAYLELTGQDRD